MQIASFYMAIFFIGFLRLVNAENPLPSDYVPESLTAYKGIQLHPAACEAFTQLISAMDADNIRGLQLHSAYRSYDRQKAIFSQKTRSFTAQGHPREAAEELAAQVVQRPGASEHQTGLALDVSTTGQLTQSFGKTPAGKWLTENAHRFGFVIRYPITKTHTTQIIYEPWHLRYVGVPHAAIMNERDLALEEYADFLAAYPSFTYLTEDGEWYLIQTSLCRFDTGLNDVTTTRIVCPLLSKEFVKTLDPYLR
jgi:D-alanyl-D-alanine carboxypeptidase